MGVVFSISEMVQLPRRGSRKKYQKRPWSAKEKAAVGRQLHCFIEQGKLPGKADCEKAIKNEDILNDRTWLNVKDFIRNQLRSAAAKKV